MYHLLQVDAWKTELVTKEANANNETDSSEDTKDQLKAQIEHYKGVLGETVINNLYLVN